jgi:hypothetical protein
MKKTIIYLVLVILINGFVIEKGNATNDISLPEILNKRNIQSVVHWDNENDTLLCVVMAHTKTDSNASTEESTLIIYKKTNDKYNKIFEFVSGAMSNLSIYPTAENRGRLVTVWLSATAYIVAVFDYSDGKVNQVLDSGSKMMPEFIKICTGNNRYTEGILITQLDWIKNSKTGDFDKIPNMTDIYQWNGKTYTLSKTVRWKNRFNYLGMTCK